VIKLYGIPNCNKIRNTRKLLEQHHIPFEFINVRKNPLEVQKIAEISRHLSLQDMFNTRGSTYRRLKLDYNNMHDTDRLNWLIREQTMIRRPLLENKGYYHIGFNEEAILKFVSAGK